MKAKQLRHIAFTLHRFIGLAIGLAIALIGLTGSLLVFSPEFSTAQVKHNLPKILPQIERVSLEQLYDWVEAYAKKHDPNFVEITDFSASEHRLFHPDEPTYFSYSDKQQKSHVIFVNPYTMEVIGNETNANYSGGFWDWLLDLHESFLAGQIGLYFVGLIGFLTTLLCLTGVILWPGWRKLISGFKIKWDSSIKRRNFDIHKVVGIIASLFLAMATFTGFCWNYNPWLMPAIYAITFSQPSPTDRGINIPIASQPISGQETVGLLRTHLHQMMQTADEKFPKSKFSNAYIDTDPKGTIAMVQCYSAHDCGVLEFDKYSGKLIRSWGLSSGVSLGDKIINTFPSIHYGFFGGLSTRIFYVFVGCTPLLLLITGFIMWQHRRKLPLAQVQRERVMQ